MGKNFNQQCYDLISQVPAGKVTTYAEVARALGTKAYRAVGNAMACNQNIPQIPCHRVVRTDHGLGGYALGLDKKITILKQEGVEVKNGKVVDFEKVFFQF